MDADCSPLISSANAAFRVGGITVRVSSPLDAGVELPPSLKCFRTDAENADVHMQIQWTPYLAEGTDAKVFDSGAIWRLYREDLGYRFDFAAPFFGDEPYKSLVIDEHFREGTLRLSDRAFKRFAGEIAPLDYPLDELLIMHRLTQDKGIELHACGIVQGDAPGNLFVGHSGAGKSTTTRLWTKREDVLVLSDDRIILRQSGPEQSAATDADCGSCATDGKRRKTFANRPFQMYGTPWHGDAMYASPENAPLGRIFIIEHGKGNMLTPLSPSQAIAELFARSFVPFHRHEYVARSLEFLQEVVDRIPVYRYAFEPDQRAVDTILNLHD
jgi:hypothetical protein